MLTIILPQNDDHDAVELQLEHSLVSLSKWESIHEKSFFNQPSMTNEETVSYIHQMLLTEKPPEDFVDRLLPEHYTAITSYINSKQTATWFREDTTRPTKEVVTNELVYYWMISFEIPFECQYWHLNRLMTLIRICGIKQTKPKKMSPQEQAEEYRRLNEQRRRDLGTSG